jgi:RND family efflux transporter MFP subunit
MNRIQPASFPYIHSLAILVVLLLPGCGEAPPPEEAPPVRPVKIMTVGDTSAGFTLEYPGEIAATRSVDLGFEVAGKIIELPIEDGLEMTEGALLGRLDPTDYEAARDAAQANLRAARSAYVRAKNIFAEGAGSQAEVDKTLRDYKVAEQELRKAQKALDDTDLKAPYDGVVGQRLADNYQNVQAKEPVLIYQDTSLLEMDVTVPERDFVRMQRGLSLEERTELGNPEVAISSIPGRAFPARIKSFTTTADPVTRTYKATFQFDKPGDVNILPGMTARVTLNPSAETMEKYSPQGGIKVPAAAVASDPQGDPYVWRIDPSTMKVSRVAVTLGEIGTSDITITSGLDMGDLIAITGVSQLHEDAQVRPLE